MRWPAKISLIGLTGRHPAVVRALTFALEVHSLEGVWLLNRVGVIITIHLLVTAEGFHRFAHSLHLIKTRQPFTGSTASLSRI